MPKGSATARSVAGERGDWTLEHMLLADLIDAVQLWGWAQVGSKKLKQPKPYPRPTAPGEAPDDFFTKETYARLREQLKRR